MGPSTNKKRKFSGTSSDENDMNNNSNPNEINHSTQLSQDFS